MTKAFGLATVALVLTAAVVSAQERLTVGGAGSMVPLMQELAKGYQSKQPQDTIAIVPGTLGSTGGIKATEAGRLGMGLTGRPLKPEEKGRLVHHRLGVMPVVIAVHADVPVASLTQAQLCAIYSGQARSWKDVGGPDMKIVPLTRNEDDSDKEALRQHVGCYRDLRESSDVMVLTKGSEMIVGLAARPGAIGLTTSTIAERSQGRLKAVALDGVTPTPEAVRKGTYRLIKEFAVVTPGPPQGASKRFLDFVASLDGRQIMTQMGLVAESDAGGSSGRAPR
ncbi:MAG: substrate-binding domain-containing protein [Candidatus Rokubacteria bacterium]|nr:substrate-binding domain-containing protein [Candidatus Rokubacteria bacterium]